MNQQAITLNYKMGNLAATVTTRRQRKDWIGIASIPSRKVKMESRYIKLTEEAAIKSAIEALQYWSESHGYTLEQA
jgi:hypothetical protein